MSNIVEDIRQIKDKFGKITLKKANKLLDDIENFLKLSNGEFSVENVHFFEKFSNISNVQDVKDRLHELELKDGDKIIKNKFDDISSISIIDINRLINVVKNFSINEKQFIINSFLDSKGSIDIKRIEEAIIKIQKKYLEINSILINLQKYIFFIDKNKINFENDLNIVLHECSDEEFVFTVQMEKNNILIEQNNLKAKLNEYHEIEKNDIRKLKNDKEILTQKITTIYYELSEEQMDIQIKFINIIKKLEYLENDKKKSLDVDYILNDIYKNIINPIQNNKTIYSPKMIILKLLDIENIVKKYDIDDEKDFYNECVILIQPYLEYISHACEQKIIVFKKKKITEHSIIRSCEKIIELTKKIREKKITLYDIKTNIIPYLGKDISTGRINKTELSNICTDGIYLLLWYYLKPKIINENYNDYKMLYEKINNDVRTIKLSLLDDKLMEIENIKKIQTENIKNLKKINEIIELIMSGTILNKIKEIEQQIIDYEEKLENVNKIHEHVKDELNKDLDISISIFDLLISINEKMEKFYNKTDDYPEISNNELIRSFDKYNKIMVGGLKITGNEIIEYINKNYLISKDVQEKILYYCRESSTLKSAYTKMYNKLKYLNKEIIYIVINNLFKLSIFKGIDENVIKINRFIKLNTFIDMKECIEKFLISNDEHVKIYRSLCEKTQNLFKKTINEMIKNSQVIEKNLCCDIALSNNSINYVIGIYLYQKIKTFSK